MANDGSRHNEQQQPQPSSSAPTFLLFHKTNSQSAGAEGSATYVPSSSASLAGTSTPNAGLTAGTSGTTLPGTSVGHHPDSESDDSKFDAT
jgi:hypothetical protein